MTKRKKKSADIPARKYKKIKSTIIDLKDPSYKWLVCRKCNLIEVKVSVEAVACVCAYCLCRACDYQPNLPKTKTPKMTRKKKTAQLSSFAKHELEAQKQAELADDFKNKQTSIKNGVVAKPKKKKTSFNKLDNLIEEYSINGT